MSPYGGNQGMNPYDMQTSPYQGMFMFTPASHDVIQYLQ